MSVLGDVLKLVKTCHLQRKNREKRTNRTPKKGRFECPKNVPKLDKLDTIKKGSKVGRGTIEKFSLTAIADSLSRLELAAARLSLSFAVGAIVDISGQVRKVVKRDGKCRLIIQPLDVPGFVVFADFEGEVENLRKPKIRKGSLVLVRGKLLSFGAAAACLSDCQMQGNSKESWTKLDTKKGNRKPYKT